MDRFELENGFLPRAAKVVAFEAREALGAPYEVRVFVSVPGDADLELFYKGARHSCRRAI